MSSDDPTLPSWVAPDMHGLRARLARWPEGVRVAMLSVAMLVGAGLGVVGLMAALLALVGLVGGNTALLPGALITLAVPVLLVASGMLALRRVLRDHVFQVTLHAFRYNDASGRFWELPLSALSHAEALSDGIVVHRKNAEPLRFKGVGPTTYERELFAWYLTRLIRDQGETVEAPPEALVRLRGRQSKAGQQV